jgi:hypothetical protein
MFLIWKRSGGTRAGSLHARLPCLVNRALDRAHHPGEPADQIIVSSLPGARGELQTICKGRGARNGTDLRCPPHNGRAWKQRLAAGSIRAVTGRHEAERRASTEGVHDLHVLLRHRPRSVSRGKHALESGHPGFVSAPVPWVDEKTQHQRSEGKEASYAPADQEFVDDKAFELELLTSVGLDPVQ